MIKTILFSKKYWYSVFFLALGFIVIFSLIEHFSEYRTINIEGFVADKLSGGKWIRYMLSRLVGGILYGMILGYHFEKRKRERDNV